METLVVDIFIPVSAGNCSRFPASLCSALTQTYPRIRVVLFLDQLSPILEKILDQWWYTKEDIPRQVQHKVEFHGLKEPLLYETCKRGFVVRNPNGPSGTAAIARQWVFEWPYKSPYVKTLDSDDILTPECVDYMVKRMTPNVDGVSTGLVKASACRFAGVIDGELALGHMGSGCMMLKRETMAKMVSEGFVWPNKSGHDKAFIEHCLEHGYKFGNTLPQNFLYMYLKT